MRKLLDVSPRFEARVAGVLYLLNILLGVAAVILIGRKMQAQGDQVNLFAALVYTVVTVLLWRLFLPVSKVTSSIAAIFSLAGCWLPQSVYEAAHLNNFVCFGVYCLLIAWLIVRSGFFPSALGLPMACAGVCWLTTIWPPLSRALSPYAMIIGVLGEATFMGYLVVKGTRDERDERRPREQAKLA